MATAGTRSSSSAPATIACGQCGHCRWERARQWALRIQHEAELWPENCFITLTFEKAPIEVSARPFQLFMKKLRKRLDKRIRFYAVHEYGERTQRVHSHAIIFNHGFREDPEPKGESGWLSPVLAETWEHGHHLVDELNFATAAYCARYCTSKARNSPEIDLVDQVTGEITRRKLRPAFSTMSRRPGIGRGFYDAYRDDFYPSDTAVTPQGRETRVPKRYDAWLKEDAPDFYEEVLAAREKRLKEKPSLTPQQLRNAEGYQQGMEALRRREREWK